MHIAKNMVFMVAGFIIYSLQITSGQEGTNMHSEPSVSPTSKIAFVSKRDGNSEIYTINPNGTELTRLTNNTFEDTFPSWSPDASYIAFVSDREGGSAIYIMKSDGTDVRRLTDQKGEVNMPTWSPDGKQIVFISDRDGNPEIYIMNSDGTKISRLTNHQAEDEWASWSSILRAKR